MVWRRIFQFSGQELGQKFPVTIDRFASRIESTGSTAKPTEKIQLRSFTEFTTENSISTIDLLKINIEGAEFPLLESLETNGDLRKIKCLLIQFHAFADNAIERRKNLQEALSKTHVKLFDYPFVWECWKLKGLQ